MNLNDMKGAMPEVKKGKPIRPIMGLVIYNLVYSIAAYFLMNRVHLPETAVNILLCVMSLISAAAIIAVGLKVLPDKNVQYKGLVYMCILAPAGVIIDWISRLA